MKKLLALSMVTLGLLATSAVSFGEEGVHSVGLQFGQVGLSGDVASSYSNALGFGGFFHYAASDWVEFELGFLNSKHSGTAFGQSISMTQNVFDAAIQYDVEQFDLFIPYLKGGVEYITHGPQDVVGTSGITNYGSLNGFGLMVGGGGEFDLSKNIMTSLDFMYHSIFDVTASAPGNPTAKAIQSYFTVLVRLGYRFGATK